MNLKNQWSEESIQKQKDWVKKHPIITGVLFVVLVIVFVSIFNGSSDSVTVKTEPALQQENAPVVNATTPTTAKKQSASKKETPKPVETTTVTASPQLDRSAILAILKARASDEWKDDYEMVQYEYNQQVEAYDWVVAQTAYPAIMAKAKKQWGYDYQMVQYEYQQQVKAFENLQS